MIEKVRNYYVLLSKEQLLDMALIELAKINQIMDDVITRCENASLQKTKS